MIYFSKNKKVPSPVVIQPQALIFLPKKKNPCCNYLPKKDKNTCPLQ